MVNRFISFVAAFSAIAVAGGCATPRGPYSPIARVDEQQPHQLRNGVTMLDQDVRNALLLVNHSAARLPSGQVQVRVQMQNLYRDETLWSDVRIAFYDADGMATDESAWQTTAFPPHQVVLVQGRSLRSDVQTFNVQFKDLRSKSGRPLGPPGQVFEHNLWRDGELPE